MPERSYGRTISQAIVTQASAGQVDIVAAPGAGMRIYVVLIVLAMDANGTFTFQEGTGPTDLTAVMPTAQNGGMVSIGDGITPVLHTLTTNSKLGVTTTGGSAKGWIRYFLDS